MPQMWRSGVRRIFVHFLMKPLQFLERFPGKLQNSLGEHLIDPTTYLVPLKQNINKRSEILYYLFVSHNDFDKGCKYFTLAN